VIGTVLLAMSAAALWSARKAAVYEATAKVLVSPLAATDDAFFGFQVLRESDDPTIVAQTAATLLTNEEVARRTAAVIGNGYEGPEISRSVDVEVVGSSNVVAVVARAPEPKLAAQLANSYTSEALRMRRAALQSQAAQRIRALGADGSDDEIRQLRRLQSVLRHGDPTLSLAQPADVPDRPSGPSDVVVLIMAGLAGLAIGAAASVFMEMINRKVRDPRELVDLYPLPILARIPTVSRARMRRSSFTSMPPAVHEAYRTLQVQVEQAAVAPLTILVASSNAGDGKTSTVVQLASALAHDERRVILMDFDLRKPQIAHALGLKAGPGIVSLLTRRRALTDVLVSPPGAPNLSVVPAVDGEDDVLLLASLAHRLPQILDEARDLADYVILDSPPLAEVSDALRLLPHVDDVIIVARPNNTDRTDFEAMRDMIERMPVLPLGLVLIGLGGLRAAYRRYGAQPPSSPAPRAGSASP
jgi:Mrp family chromosome partitioning ATPase/capsular polysaccharide biosynthesis protein